MSTVYHIVNSPTLRRCYTCLDVKPLQAFKKCLACKSGYKGQCKECYNRRKRGETILVQPFLFPYKVCTECQIEKLLDEFTVDRSKEDGRYPQCKECRQKQRASVIGEERKQLLASKRAWREANIERVRAHDRARSATESARMRRHARSRIKSAERRAKRLLELQHTPPPPPKTEKVCPKCEEEKPIIAFARNKYAKDGYQCYCKICTNDYAHSRLDKRREHEQIKRQDVAYRQQLQNEKRRWRHQNAERIRQRNRLKYATDPEFVRRTRKHTLAWFAAHPMQRREHQMRRKARIRATISDEVDYARILERNGYWCHICNQPILAHHTLAFDHVLPLIPRPGEPQGTHTEDNIRPAHKECNSRKSNRRLESLTPFDRRGVSY